MLSVNVGQVSNQFIVVPLRIRMEKYVLDLMKFCVCRWREHFDGILNVISSSDQATLDIVKEFPLRCGLSGLPTK